MLRVIRLSEQAENLLTLHGGGIEDKTLCERFSINKYKNSQCSKSHYLCQVNEFSAYYIVSSAGEHYNVDA